MSGRQKFAQAAKTLRHDNIIQRLVFFMFYALLWWRILLPAFVAARVSPENPPVNIPVVISGTRAIIRPA
jgi:hypothetical protein